MRSKRRIVTIGSTYENLVETYAAKRDVSFSAALVMIIEEWASSPKGVALMLEAAEKTK